MSTKARKGAPRPAPIERPEPPAELHSPPGIRFRVDFHDRCSVGIGKISLLEAIARTGTLSRAARDLGMSYRRAWLLIDSMNADFDTPVVSATVGGSGGGGAQLTPLGRELVQAYRNLEARIAALAVEHMSEVGTHAAGTRRSARPARRQKLSVPLT